MSHTRIARIHADERFKDRCRRCALLFSFFSFFSFFFSLFSILSVFCGSQSA